jgi:hypothetical protein
MRWFKHMSLSQHDETLSELMDKFGAEGYGVWWIVLEKIAQLMDETGRCFARFSLKVWATSAKVSAKKFQNIVGFLEKKSTFILKNEDGFLTIECPNLLKYRDEWTDKKAKAAIKNRDKLPSDSRVNTGVTPDFLRPDPDTDTELDKDIYKKPKPSGLVKKEKFKCPDNFCVTEKHLELAKKNDWPSPDDEIEAFRDYHIAHGNKFADWDRAFYTWMRNSRDRFPRATKPIPKNIEACPFDEIFNLYEKILVSAPKQNPRFNRPVAKPANDRGTDRQNLILKHWIANPLHRERDPETGKLVFWQAVFEKVLDDEFLSGRRKTESFPSGFTPDIEYLLRSVTFGKLIDSLGNDNA